MMLSRRKFMEMTAIAAAAGVNLIPLSAFAQQATPIPVSDLPAPPAPGPIDLEAAGGLDALIEAARAETDRSGPRRGCHFNHGPAR